MTYSQGFKEAMVAKMLAGRSASSLARETGVSQPTLSRWLREADKLGTMSTTTTKKSPKPRRRPQDWTPEQRLEAVLEAAALPDDDLGTFLRRRGLHQAELAEWRRHMIAGLEQRRKPPRGRSPEQRRMRELERELQRKEAALAETAALLVLKKKVRTSWEAEDGATSRRRGR